ncbi:MAG: hypothetical protein ACRD2G_18170 [Terriglobia bacterium]
MVATVSVFLIVGLFLKPTVNHKAFDRGYRPGAKQPHAKSADTTSSRKGAFMRIKKILITGLVNIFILAAMAMGQSTANANGRTPAPIPVKVNVVISEY